MYVDDISPPLQIPHQNDDHRYQPTSLQYQNVNLISSSSAIYKEIVLCGTLLVKLVKTF